MATPHTDVGDVAPHERDDFVYLIPVQTTTDPSQLIQREKNL